MKRKNLEIQVGGFVLVGLISLGILVVSFGRVGQFFHSRYELTAEFENASGIIKNSQVLYRGAKVGSVTSAPRISGEGQYVELDLSIKEGIQIDKKSKFKIGLYGLLGDRFVDIIPPEKASDDYFQPGDHVKGEKNKGFDEITEKLDTIADTVEKKLMTEDFAVDLQKAVKNIREISEKMNRIMTEAEQGKGALHTLLKDESVAANIKEMVREFKQLGKNLRANGILFYEDMSGKEEESKNNDASQLKPARSPFNSKRR